MCMWVLESHHYPYHFIYLVLRLSVPVYGFIVPTRGTRANIKNNYAHAPRANGVRGVKMACADEKL